MRKEVVISEPDDRKGKACRHRPGLGRWLVLTGVLVGAQSATRCYRRPTISASQSSLSLQAILHLAFWGPSAIQTASYPYTVEKDMA